MGLIFVTGLLFYGWAEVSAFVFIGDKIGGLLTLFGVFLTALIGISLLKNQGLSILHRVRKDMSEGRAPVTSIADSIALIVGGILMLIPGYLSDALGSLLFIPGLRTIAGVCLLKWISNSRQFSGYANPGGSAHTQRNGQHSHMDIKQDFFSFVERGHQQEDTNDIIEGEFEERPYSQSETHQQEKEKS